MITAGIDIGSITAKAAVLNDGHILGTKVMFTGYNAKQAGKMVLDDLLKEIQLGSDAVHAVVSTGYGRNSVDFADKSITEITCHGVGAHFIRGRAGADGNVATGNRHEPERRSAHPGA
mgnify:CR=1 FL=1